MQQILRMQICLDMEFEKPKTVFDEESGHQLVWKSTQAYFCGNMELIMKHEDIAKKAKISFVKILKSIDAFMHRGSGWRVKSMQNLSLKIGKYRPFKGGCLGAVPKSLA